MLQMKISRCMVNNLSLELFENDLIPHVLFFDDLVELSLERRRLASRSSYIPAER